MPAYTPEQIRDLFPVGAVVRPRDEALDDWTTEMRRRIAGRLGEVIGHGFPGGDPIVAFPAIGRKGAFRHRFSNPARYLEAVTDADVLAQWRAGVAKAARRPSP